MTDPGVAGLGLVEVAAKIRSRELSSIDVTRACLERLNGINPRLNCVVGLDAEAALQAADLADRTLARGQVPGPLLGVPLAHKDMFYRSGRRTGCGSRILADFVPDYTATALRRLDDAGALDIARLHMSEFALGATGHNEILGHARNPWNVEHVPGGSSSGSAAAVACGAVYGALGSDTGGSARQPAAFCGVVGLKPTFGRISRHGMMPLSSSVDSAGIIARTVEDCALLFEVVAGHDPRDPTTVDQPVPRLGAVSRTVRGLRVAVPENYFYDPVAPEVSALVGDSVSVFKSLGAEIVPVRIPSIELASPLMSIVVAVEAATIHGRFLRERREEYGAQTLARLLPGLLYPATRYVEALTLRQKVLADFREAVFSRADALHTPTMPMLPPTVAESDVGDRAGFMTYLAPFGQCTRPASFLGLPAISVPAGLTRQGLPCGFQMIGRPFDEATLFTLAHAYERETRFARLLPPVCSETRDAADRRARAAALDEPRREGIAHADTGHTHRERDQALRAARGPEGCEPRGPCR